VPRRRVAAAARAAHLPGEDVPFGGDVDGADAALPDVAAPAQEGPLADAPDDLVIAHARGPALRGDHANHGRSLRDRVIGLGLAGGMLVSAAGDPGAVDEIPDGDDGAGRGGERLDRPGQAGCQGEVGSACSMAADGVAEFLGGSIHFNRPI